MKKSERLVYQNSNQEKIEISFYSVYTPLSFTEDLDNDMTTSKNNLQDGETFISDSLDPRSLKITGCFQLEHSNQLERQLKKVFNPKLSGKLIFSDIDGEKYINVRVDSLPEITRGQRMATFAVELTAHDPFWREQERTEYIALLTPKLHFPLVIPKGIGFVWGVKRSILETEVQNVGDAACGFRVIFKAKGSVSNPLVKNSYTGEQIRLLYEMQKGDIIEVVNEPNRKLIYINGQKDFAKLDRLQTTFFSLAPGKNMLGYAADENVVNLDVIVYYSPLYL